MNKQLNDDAIGFQLVTVARLMRQRFEAALADAELNMTPGEARTLMMADRLGAVRQNELAAALSIEPMSLRHRRCSTLWPCHRKRR